MMVERCAWAWLTRGEPFDAVAWQDMDQRVREIGMQAARNVIEAMREPTEAMVRALNSYAQCEGYIEEGWRAAIAAALGEEGT